MRDSESTLRNEIFSEGNITRVINNPTDEMFLAKAHESSLGSKDTKFPGHECMIGLILAE